MLSAVFNSFSAFFHVDSSSSDEVVVIPHLSSETDRCFSSACGAAAPEEIIASTSVGVQRVSNTFLSASVFAQMTS